MLNISTREYFNPKAIARPVRNAARSVLMRQAAYTRGVARRKISKRKVSAASAAGTPPYTHNMALKRSILFGVGDVSAVIGPARSLIGGIAHTHEWGGREYNLKGNERKNQTRGRHYPARPFMRPTLSDATPRLAEMWRNSVRQHA